jgi:phosphatidylglycerol:prolipoprotein diacylglycerol transferase
VVAVLTLSFDPVVRLSETASVRLETIVLAAVLFGGLVLAVRIGKLAPAPGLRIDDLVFMVVGAVPGAVVGGRLGYVLDHLAFYQANPSLIADPAQGGLTLTLAVPLGMLTGAIIGRLLGAPIGRWMHALAVPLLFVLGAGKMAGVLGGTGQGLPSDATWATAYLGPGPWGSLAADLPSHPSQVYEGLLVGIAVLAFWPLARLPLLRRGTGTAMWVGVGLWCAIRFFAGFTWRDPLVLGELRMEQLLALGVAVIAGIGLLLQARRPGASAPPSAALPATAPSSADAAMGGEGDTTGAAGAPEGSDQPHVGGQPEATVEPEAATDEPEGATDEPEATDAPEAAAEPEAIAAPAERRRRRTRRGREPG